MDGPAIVLAGPGSGKTTVITERIKYLIQHGIPPEEILVVTFTKAAAFNMQRRFCDASSSNCAVHFGTFHSVFYQMLKNEYGYERVRMISTSEKRDYLKQCMLYLKIDAGNMEEFISNAISEIEKIKGNLLPISSVTSTMCGTENIRKIYTEYEKTLRAEGKYDFDDLLIQTYQLLKNHEDILKKWRKTYRYILIDEFQDINFLQYEIIKMLSAPNNHLFVVGDDDQSIYGFRGSRPEIMLNFQKDYPNAEKVLLNVNYRCSETIVRRAECLIQHNRVRAPKSMTAAKKGGNRVSVRLFANQGDELAYMVRQIQGLLKSGVEENQIAILVRNNSQIPVIQNSLQNNHINTAGKRQKDPIYSGMVFQDILAYIHAAKNYQEQYLNENADLISIVNKPQRYISRDTLLQETMTFKKLKELYTGSVEVLRNIENLQFHLKMISGMTPYAMVNYIRKGVGYENYLYDYAKERSVRLDVLIRQLGQIQQDAGEFYHYDQWMDFIKTRRSQIEPGGQGINLLTMHGAKGLEFRVVLIPDANQGIIPSKQILRQKDFEEERRLFYVAMTRAADELYIYACRNRLGNPLEISMFVDELLGK